MDWNLIKPIVKKWSKNRDPDTGRVQDLLVHISNGGYFPPVLHLAYLDGEGMVCYDGNHRREALNAMVNPPKVIVYLLTKANQNDVYNAFDAINKCVQVPAIYFDDTSSATVKDDLLKIVRDYESKFKTHLSSSPRCHAPHFNRDMFLDNLHKIWTYHGGRLSVEALEKALTSLNIMYSKGRVCKTHDQYKTSVIDKMYQVMALALY